MVETRAYLFHSNWRLPSTQCVTNAQPEGQAGDTSGAVYGKLLSTSQLILSNAFDFYS